MKRQVICIVLGVCIAVGGIALGDEPFDFQQLVTDAENGNARSQYELGVQYRAGTQVEKNYALALKWLTRAAMQGQVDAQLGVAVCYNNGEGTLPDRIKAYAWYLVASMNGNEHARVKQRIYASTLNKRQLIEGQKLAKTIAERIGEVRRQTGGAP